MARNNVGNQSSPALIAKRKIRKQQGLLTLTSNTYIHVTYRLVYFFPTRSNTFVFFLCIELSHCFWMFLGFGGPDIWPRRFQATSWSVAFASKYHMFRRDLRNPCMTQRVQIVCPLRGGGQGGAKHTHWGQQATRQKVNNAFKAPRGKISEYGDTI